MHAHLLHLIAAECRSDDVPHALPTLTLQCEQALRESLERLVWFARTQKLKQKYSIDKS